MCTETMVGVQLDPGDTAATASPVHGTVQVWVNPSNHVE